jgi:uncharacterized protein (TIGR00251 family)
VDGNSLPTHWPEDWPWAMHSQGCAIAIKVTPNAKRNEILPMVPDEPWLRVKVTVVPEDGKANDAVIRLIAKTLGIAPSRIEVLSGHTSRQKRLLIRA